MKRIIFMVIALITMSAGLIAFAGNSGVSDPTITLKNNTPADLLRTRTLASLASLKTASDANIDVVDAIVGGTQEVTLAPASILVGNESSNKTAVAVSGAITITTNGVTDISARQVAGAELEVVAPGYLFVGSASSNAEPVVVSGAITMSDAGATAFLTSGISTNYTSVTNFDITIVDGRITVFTSN